jgi:diacylglycerol O-acyltransferase / wax synthase
MQRLHGIDPMFIYSETPSSPMEVAYACVLNPETAPQGYCFESVRRTLGERLPALPPFRRRMVHVPFGLDHPRWVDDPHFDLANHLHRAAVPAPHGEDEFRTLVATIMGRPLCPEQPPWEMHVIEGLAGGRVGLVAKVHHSAIDGVAGAQLLAQLLDLTAEGLPVTDACAPWTPPSLPSNTSLIADAVPHLIASPVRTLRALRELGRTTVRMARCALDGATGPLSIPLFAPKTFGAPVVADREVAFGVLSLEDINQVRRTFGVTINDVVLAVCSGALRSHLGAEAVAQVAGSPLVAVVPVSVRPQEGDDGLGNRLSAMFVSLANDRPTPAERLEAVAASSAASKAQERAVGYAPLASAVAEAVPPALAKPMVQATMQLGALRRLRAGNLMVSNVPGPDFPLYFSGMRLEAIHPLGPVIDGVALNVTVQSYENSLFVGINSSAHVVDDVDGLAQSMVQELTALVEAASERIAQLPAATEERGRAVTGTTRETHWTSAVPLGAVRTANADPSRWNSRRQVRQVQVHKGMSWD